MTCIDRLIRAAIFLLCFLLSACGIQSPGFDTFMYVFPSYRQYAEVKPGIEYLVVELDGRAALMALGAREIRGSAPFIKVTERWYNAKGEMLVLEDGRITQAFGLSQEWRSQTSDAPTWREVDESRFRVEWHRTLDLMPGYRYGQVDQITTGKIAPLRDVSKDIPSNAQWYADVVESQTRAGRPWRFLQKFAVSDNRVVYSEQCISEDVCLRLRPLNAAVKP